MVLPVHEFIDTVKEFLMVKVLTFRDFKVVGKACKNYW
jgi:hypothetical protein